MLVCISTVIWVIVLNDKKNQDPLCMTLFPYSQKELDIVSLDTIQHVSQTVVLFSDFFFMVEVGDISFYLLRIIGDVCACFLNFQHLSFRKIEMHLKSHKD